MIIVSSHHAWTGTTWSDLDHAAQYPPAEAQRLADTLAAEQMAAGERRPHVLARVDEVVVRWPERRAA